ncbi:hypothetical protein EJB05_26136, partial [Eragrostis curvula]
ASVFPIRSSSLPAAAAGILLPGLPIGMPCARFAAAQACSPWQLVSECLRHNSSRILEARASGHGVAG